MVGRLQLKPIGIDAPMELTYFHDLEERLSDFNFQIDILRNKEICSDAVLALVEVSKMLEYARGYSAGYEKGKADGAATPPYGAQH